MKQHSRRLWTNLFQHCPTCGYRPQTSAEAKALVQSACTACGSVEQYYKRNPNAWVQTLVGLDQPAPVDKEGEAIDVVNTPERARERERALEYREIRNRRGFIFALLVMIAIWLGWIDLF